MTISCSTSLLRTMMLVCVLVGLASAASANTRVPESSRFGVVDDHISTSPLAVQAIRDAGFGWVKYLLFWNFTNPHPNVDCEPRDGKIDASDDCNFDWTHADLEIQRLADAGLNVYVHVVYPPTWTMGATYPNDQTLYCYEPGAPQDLRNDEFNCRSGERRPGYRAEYSPENSPGNAYPPSYDRTGDFRMFVEAAVRRYRDRVRAWGFGTEVHSRVFWRGTWDQFFDEILRPGYEVVKQVDPSLLVVGPEEDQIEERPGVIGAFEYLLNLETARGVRVLDVISFHVLSQTRPWSGDAAANLAQMDSRLLPLVDRVRRGRPLWLTEVGYYHNGGEVVDGLVASWFAEMLAGIAARPWVDKTFVYRLKHMADPDFGILSREDVPKPAYTAVQQFISTQPMPTFYYLAEGATSIFELEIAVANPSASFAPVKLSFLLPDGSVRIHTDVLPPTSRRTYNVAALPALGLESVVGVSTVVESTTGVPLLVERTMAWDQANGYGAHGGGAVPQPETRWYFGEGSQGFFDTYLLLANSSARAANVEVTFLREGDAPVVVSRTVGATSRVTLWAGEVPEIAAVPGTSFSIVVNSDVPIIAERAMYFGRTPFWTGGHGSAGVPALATTWFHAEGATGAYFDEYLLVGNPGEESASVTFTFLLDTGQTVVGTATVPAMSRFTLNVENADSLLQIVSGDASWLKDAAVSAKVESSVPIVSERAMYWPYDFTQWMEAHNSFGVTATATRWGLAEGRVGGARGYETYILLANPNPVDARVRVTYLRTDGTTIPRDIVVPSNSRLNEHANSVPGLRNEAFGVVIEATDGVPIVVERAMYWNALGQRWSAGTNALATPLP